MIELKRLTLDDKSKIESFTAKFPPYSDFNFISLYSWSLHSQTSFYIDDEKFLLKLPDYSSQEFILSFMILKNFNKNFLEILDFLDREEITKKFDLLPEILVPQIRSFFERSNLDYVLKEDRGSFDYILNINKTVNAFGNEYKKYRQRLSRFNREWSASVRPYAFDPQSESHIEKAEHLLKDWVVNKQPNNINYEYEGLAFSRFLTIARHSDRLIFKAFENNSKLVGLSGYEIIDSNNAIGHFIKYDPGLQNMFFFLIDNICKDLQKRGINNINIEQDLDIPTLRLSKEHLRPSDYLKKFSLRVGISDFDNSDLS